MRRGLIEWSKDEVSERTYAARIAAVRTAMAAHGVDALIAYTNISRTSAVSWLCAYIPFWSEALLVVPRDGRPAIVAGFGPRSADWVAATTCGANVVCTADIAAAAVRIINAALPGAPVTAVVELNDIPAAIGSTLASSDASIIDGTAVYQEARTGNDSAAKALKHTAAAIAHTALAAAAGYVQAADAVAAVERCARLAGAEEIYVAVAPDLHAARQLIRLDRAQPLGPVFAVRATVAYKGAWVRMVRTVVRSRTRAALETATARFATAVRALPDTRALAAFDTWLIEGERAGQPLAAIAGSALESNGAVRGGANVQAAIVIDDTPILLGAPVVAGCDGAAGTFLVAPAF